MNFPTECFENVHQVGGISTATLDNGPGRGSRVAYVNTGAGLRYTVALDRGADLVHAHFNQHALAYLTQNGIKPPSHAYHLNQEWLTGWPGGLLTTGGPVHIGNAREEDGQRTTLHGRYSNQPTELEILTNPDPHLDKHDICVSAIIRDSRGYGPNMEVRRNIRSTLGENHIHILDQTTNRDPRSNPFALLYHLNLGWPLLDHGSRLVLSGDIEPWPDHLQDAPQPEDLEDYKRVLGPQQTWIDKSRGFIVTPSADEHGWAHVGLINQTLGLALEVAFPVDKLPRVMIWQHYAPGMYVCGLEPMVGTPFGKHAEPDHARSLLAGQTQDTELRLTVHSGDPAVSNFAKFDRRLNPA